ncbi:MULTISPECIES: hypothetical protein [unclassified Crossiella]|uniref:hypothetical protein n=1 Tax=unclassified Crossiella TaxID=2620835 RepID=UPI001FFF9F5B|nr:MULTISPECIES: hypothetical protein [unclassified Crossiella]MCK2243727.1 hypothetical protein [Crossiella sp. S99.2]MCK2257586.1 hypothetical protein [Crossiella sp. S99.1]
MRAHRDAEGRICRWTMTSRVFKGERNPIGAQAEWVAGAAAARAVQVLEEVQLPEAEYLFGCLSRKCTRPGPDALKVATTNRLLNDLLARAGLPGPGVPRHPDR